MQGSETRALGHTKQIYLMFKKLQSSLHLFPEPAESLKGLKRSFFSPTFGSSESSKDIFREFHTTPRAAAQSCALGMKKVKWLSGYKIDFYHFRQQHKLSLLCCHFPKGLAQVAIGGLNLFLSHAKPFQNNMYGVSCKGGFFLNLSTTCNWSLFQWKSFKPMTFPH